MKFDDRIIYTDNAKKEWYGWYNGTWEGFADILLDVIQPDGSYPVASKIKVNPNSIKLALPAEGGKR